jgi:hypothetical protein
MAAVGGAPRLADQSGEAPGQLPLALDTFTELDLFGVGRVHHHVAGRTVDGHGDALPASIDGVEQSDHADDRRGAERAGQDRRVRSR